MSERAKPTKASDLPTKTVRGPNGKFIRLKVVKSDSPTLGRDLLGAFKSNVRRVREVRRKGDAADPA